MTAVRPCFDNTADIIKFTLEAPMDYTIERQPVTMSGDGLEWQGKPQIASSPSSDEEYVPKTGSR